MHLSTVLLITLAALASARPNGFDDDNVRIVSSSSYSDRPAKVAPVSSITTRKVVNPDPTLINSSVNRAVGLISNIVGAIGGFVIQTINDFPPPPKVVTTHVEQGPTAAVKTVHKTVH